MYPRTNYEMTQSDLEKIIEACRPVPMVMIQTGMGKSPQQRANDAWAELGSRMGFDYMTVRPTGAGDRFFTAVPSETEQHRKERLVREKEASLRSEETRLKSEIQVRQDRLTIIAGEIKHGVVQQEAAPAA